MSDPPAIYVLDTNVFVQAHRRHYAFEICPGFWECLIHYHQTARIVSIDRVAMRFFPGMRNAVVAALAHEVFVAHAEPRSKTEILCRDIISWGKGLYTFENSANHDLIELGAQSLSHGQSQLAEVDAP